MNQPPPPEPPEVPSGPPDSPRPVNPMSDIPAAITGVRPMPNQPQPQANQPQIVQIVTKSGGISRAIFFMLGLFLFGAVFFIGLGFGMMMMFGARGVVPTAIVEATHRTGDKRNVVAVIPVVGIINQSQAAYVHDAVEHILDKKNSHIKTVVLRVDSPGGGVTSSDEIWYEIKRLTDAGYPVIASYGSVAASGGYYISCAADQIIAQPTCITGSIGVIAQIFTLEGLMDKVGIEPVTLIASGSPNKATANDIFRSWDEKDRQKVQAMLDEMYDIFNQRVRDGRKSVITSTTTIDALADGSIYTADEALKNGLIDAVGYLDDAIAAAEKAKGLRKGSATVVMLRQPPSFMDKMMANTQSPLNAQLDADAIRSFVNDLSSTRIMYLMQGR
ncbi:MAG: signal peptide peptidase SppA [Planctomycetes bacterium]|nr:signal peptide peptidase SppA [Planctomycetota bacterium]